MSTTVKLSATTLAILKNFATINPSILVDAGNTLKTISPQRNIVAIAEVPEAFPTFAIYDLNQFLGALSLFANPVLTMGEKSLTISNDGAGTALSKLEYFYADPKLLSESATVPASIKSINFDATLSLLKTQLEEVQRAASVLSLPEVQFRDLKDDVVFEAIDTHIKASNHAGVTIKDGNSGGNAFKIVFKCESLKLLPTNYDVSFGVKKIAHFASTADGINVQYYVAPESQSIFSAASSTSKAA